MACFSATFGLLDDFIWLEDLSFLEFCDIIVSHFLSLFLSSLSMSVLPSLSLVPREKSHHVLSLTISLCSQMLPKHFVKLLNTIAYSLDSGMIPYFKAQDLLFGFAKVSSLPRN